MSVTYTRLGDDTRSQKTIIRHTENGSKKWVASIIYPHKKGYIDIALREGTTQYAFSRMLKEFGFPPEQKLLWKERF